VNCQVEYENHSSFRGISSSDGFKKESPVRIFTNIDPATVVLPASEGYWCVCLKIIVIIIISPEYGAIRNVCVRLCNFLTTRVFPW